jgi:hypothetical protein
MSQQRADDMHRNTQADNQFVRKYGLLMLEISKLLSEMAEDAKAHGFDISPYLAKLAEMNIVDAPCSMQRATLINPGH